MKWIKSSVNFAAFSLLCLDLLSISSFSAQVKAESFPGNQPWQISQAFKPPKRADPPPSAGGSTRGSSCLQKKTKLIALLPPNKLGLTLAERPTFFWFVPSTSIKTAKFILLDKDDNVFYETTLTLPNKPGIISFTLPNTAPKLPVGKTYHWYLTVVCNARDSSTNPWVDGWVERTQANASLSAALAKAQPQQLPRLYAEAGIWHEALVTSVQLRRTDPKNLRTRMNWQTFLKSVNLSALASEPFIDCCTSDKGSRE